MQNQGERYKIFKMLLARLREKNLTLNRDKCEFIKAELWITGHILSDKGLKIDENNVKAGLKIKEPTNSSEVKSFLILVVFFPSLSYNIVTI